MWVLERQGTGCCDKREFDSLEKAQEVMEKEYKKRLDNGYDYCIDDDMFASIGDCEYFQAWDIYEKKDNLTELEKAFEEIEIQFNRIYNGIEQYSFELMDTGVINYHVNSLKEMINELKEMI